MLSLAVIGPAIFFLPGFAAFVENYTRNTPKTLRQGHVATSTAAAFTAIVFMSVFVHAILLGLLLAISQFLASIGSNDLGVPWPGDAFTGKGGLSHIQLFSLLAYAIIATVSGYWLGRQFKEKTTEDTILGLFKYAETSDELQAVAYVYLADYPPGQPSEGGYVGAVSEMRLTSEGAISWVQIIDPNRFTVDAFDGEDGKRVQIMEWKAGRTGGDDALEAHLPVSIFTSEQFSHVVVALFHTGTSEQSDAEFVLEPVVYG